MGVWASALAETPQIKRKNEKKNSHLRDEAEVVRDEDQAAVPLLDGFGQGVNGLDVQRVGGLMRKGGGVWARAHSPL